jgi:hypothetical protein
MRNHDQSGLVSSRRRLVFWITIACSSVPFLLLGTLGLAACKQKVQPLVPELAGQGPTRPTPAPTPAPQPLRIEPVELIAKARGNVLWLTVVNHLPNRNLLVGPKMVGVIVDGALYPYQPSQVTSRFPVRTLGPGAGASGVFRFSELKSLEGGRMVFNCPGVGNFVARIEPAEAGLQGLSPRTTGPVAPTAPRTPRR